MEQIQYISMGIVSFFLENAKKKKKENINRWLMVSIRVNIETFLFARAKLQTIIFILASLTVAL